MHPTLKKVVPLRDGLWHLGQVNDAAELRDGGMDEPRELGLRLAAEEKFQESIPPLQHAVNEDPEDFAARLALGQSLAKASRWGHAEAHLARAAALRPKSREARFSYGDVLLKVGKFPQAEREFVEATRLRPLWKKLTMAVRSLVQPEKFRLDSNPPTHDSRAKLAFARARGANIEHARRNLADADPNPEWRRSQRGRRLNVPNQPLIRRETKIFAIGSCFALEIRHELMRRGFDVYPKYGAVAFDPATQILNSLPDRDNVNHYDTFTIRQEFELAFGDRHFDPSSFWQIRGRSINKVMGQEVVWQDPHRKNIYASDEAGLIDLSRKVDRCIRQGIMDADVYVITLGLIETWRDTVTGLHACSYPGTGGGGGAAQCALHIASFQDNYENLRRVCELVFGRFPDKKIILTVSPVALEKTFTAQDVVVANTESKAQLRAVAGQICREFPNVSYFPSFELFLYHDLFHDNGRHVARDGVSVVVDFFANCFLAPEAAELPRKG